MSWASQPLVGPPPSSTGSLSWCSHRPLISEEVQDSQLKVADPVEVAIQHRGARGEAIGRDGKPRPRKLAKEASRRGEPTGEVNVERRGDGFRREAIEEG